MPIAIDRAEIETFRSLVGRRLGLAFEDGKLDYLADILRSRLEATNHGHGGSYLSRLSVPVGWREEWRVLAEKLTVAETYFFRYWDHFRAFGEVILPAYTDLSRRSRGLRILSAGCASGEEVYSLAILIRDRIYDPSGFGMPSIVGIDINPAMIERASRARYSPWSLRCEQLHREAGRLREVRGVDAPGGAVLAARQPVTTIVTGVRYGRAVADPICRRLPSRCGIGRA